MIHDDEKRAGKKDPGVRSETTWQGHRPVGEIRTPPGRPWNISQAREIQAHLASRVIRRDDLGTVTRVAGVDVSYDERHATGRAAAAVLALPGLELVEYALAWGPIPCPYIPGLFSFREAPLALAAIRKLACPPDLLLCDGQGIAHPQRFGLACHIGLESGLPAIGVAKNRLIGEYAPVGPEQGAWSVLQHRGEVIGAVLRTCPGVKPLFVSPGHRVGLEHAVACVMCCMGAYRRPEPLRQAHRLAAGGNP